MTSHRPDRPCPVCGVAEGQPHLPNPHGYRNRPAPADTPRENRPDPDATPQANRPDDTLEGDA